MFNVDQSIGGRGGPVVAGLRGEPDVAVAAWLAAIAAGGPQIIVGLAGLEFIDSRGVAALVRGRKLARRAGGDRPRGRRAKALLLEPGRGAALPLTRKAPS